MNEEEIEDVCEDEKLTKYIKKHMIPYVKEVKKRMRKHIKNQLIKEEKKNMTKKSLLEKINVQNRLIARLQNIIIDKNTLINYMKRKDKLLNRKIVFCEDSVQKKNKCNINYNTISKRQAIKSKKEDLIL